MSKLGCSCGNTIFDKTNSLPYKAHFYRDQDWEQHDNYGDEVQSFLEAVYTGKRTLWIINRFGDSYPLTLSDSSIICDIIDSATIMLESTMYQCQKCGRILIQVGESNHYASFRPEDDRGQNIFASIQKQ